jgi:hypothetical protein
VVPRLEIRYLSATSIGLFEQTSAGYGEIWYDLGGRRTMSRATTAEGVLEAIYALAGVSAESAVADEEFRGHPLASPPRHAGLVYYALWPAAVTTAALLWRHNWRS